MTKPVDIDRVRITFNVRAPMRDGVTLSADVYLPVAEGKYPVLLSRTPYLKNSENIFQSACHYVEMGFAVVWMDVRGRGDSDGVFVPHRNEGRDGYDAIEWCAAQPWSNGSIGTLGGSYLGYVQWMAALLRPPHLHAMSVAVTPSDPFVEAPTGLAFTPMYLCWLHLVSGRVTQNMDAVNWAQVYQHLPLRTMDEAAGRVNPWWRESFDHPQFDEYWDAVAYQKKFGEVNVPVLHITGWYDDEQIGTPINYVGMTKNARTEHARANQKMLIGPWDHAINTKQELGEIDFSPSAIIELREYQARWFKHWLAGDENSITAEPPVRIFVMGVNEWRDEHEWPLARAIWTPFYLHSSGSANSRFGDGALSTVAPADEPPDHYDYDPARPVTFITDQISSQIGGPDDYAAIEQRGDVLVYTTPPLDADLEVTGPIRVTLHAASSAPDTDFMAKLLDVWPTGFAQRLCDGMVRARFRDGMASPKLIEPGQVYEYSIDCWNTSVVFRKGHALRLEIASSAFPKFDRNLNTGTPLGLTSEMAVAAQTIYHDAQRPSHVLLPVIPA